MPRHSLAALLAVLFLAGPSVVCAREAPINAVVGDVSWVEHTGHLPTREEARTQDHERHRVHLAWVERHLRAQHHAALSPAQHNRRLALLDALAAYRERGVHPINARTTRLPRFLDAEGRICAVGYLMEVSRGRAFVERVNQRWEYDLLADIEDPEIAAWAKHHGFTLEELASIQPTGAPAIGFGELSISDETGDDLLFGTVAGLILGADVALMTSLVVADGRASQRSRERLAASQLTFGGLQLIGGLVVGGAALNDAFQERLTGPLVATAVAFSVVSLIEMGYALFSLLSHP
ncbi:MAG: hypothetical protein AB8I08_00215 [Sandaracinaceae bacterium]